MKFDHENMKQDQKRLKVNLSQMHQYDFYRWFTTTYLEFSTETDIGRIEFEVLNIFIDIYQTDLEQP